MEIEGDYRWLSLLNAQAGVVSRQQAQKAGWSEKAIDRRLRSGSWQRIQRGAYATFSGIPSREARLWAAVLRAGPGAALHRGRGLVAQWQPPWQLPRTPVEDTVLDLVGAARSFDDAYGWISAAVGRRLTTPEMLGQALGARSRMRWRDWVSAALEDAAEGVQRELRPGSADAEVRLA
jgi:hypothetical protein